MPGRSRTNTTASPNNPTTKRSVGRPAGSDRAENIARIMEAAIRCFGEKGYAATNFTDISNEVGLTRSAMYSYYANKSELYHAVVINIQQQRIGQLSTIINTDQSFEQKLEAILEIFVCDHEQNHELSTFLSSVPIEIKRYPELIMDDGLDNSIPALLIDFFQDAINQGQIVDRFSAEDLVVTFLGGTMGMSLFQHSIGLGDVRRAVGVTMSMLKQQFLV